MTIFGIDNRISSNYNNVFRGVSLAGNFTGALISPDLVISAAHVKKGGIRTYFETSEGLIEGKEVYSDIDADIILFQLTKQLKITPFILNNPTQQLLNLSTTLVGFHADRKGQSSETKQNTILVESYVDELQYDLDAYNGSSGGPILDYQNRLIGINHSGYSTKNIGTPINNKLINTIINLDNKVGGKSKIKKEKPLINSSDINRILDKKTGAHLYTSDIEVVKDLTNDSRFIVEDKWKSGDNSVWEFYNSKSNDFFYTSDYMEMLYVDDKIPDYQLNDRVFGVDENTIHRVYNPISGHHFYTDSLEEKDSVIANLGFVDEGFL